MVVAPAPAGAVDFDALADSLNGGRLAMALVDAVPAGIYGKQALQALGLWDQLRPSVAQADNVRGALALVATGAAPLGIVYGTDAAAEPRVDVVATFAPEVHDAIRYPVSALAQGDADAAQRFLDYLATPVARSVFEGQGFKVLP